MPAHVVGNSGGAAIALRLAAKRPDLRRSLVVHEPPLVGLLEGRPEFDPMISGFYSRVGAVLNLLNAGQMERGAQEFVDTLAFGPGAWNGLPQPMWDTFIQNAPTFLDECNDPHGLMLDLNTLCAFDRPSRGRLAPTVQRFSSRLRKQLPRHCRRVPSIHTKAPATCRISHPALYSETVDQLLRRQL